MITFATLSPDTIPIAFASFIAGLLIGFFGRGFMIKNNQPNPEAVGNQFVLVVVTIIWASSVLFSFVNPTYQVSPLLHGLMGAIVGFFYKPFKKDDNIPKV